MNYKKILIPLCLFATSLSLMAQAESSNVKLSISSDWLYKQLEDESLDSSSYSSPELSDSDWEVVSLPHTANIEPLLVNDQWQGICWYRKELKVPSELEGKQLVLEFEAAMNYSEFWINGVQVAENHGGYLPVVIDVTDYLEIGELNQIAIRLDNTDNEVTGPKPLAILDFNMYGGLYRNAWLIAKEPVHISHPVLADKVGGGGIFITTPRVSEAESWVQIKTHIVNDTDELQSVSLKHAIYYGDEVVATDRARPRGVAAEDDINLKSQLKVKNAKLWSPDRPELYHLETKLFVDGELVETQKTRFGIRSFEFRGTDLYINGKQTYLRGTNRHQEYPFVGYALSDNAQYRDAKKIKDAGFDYIRLSHYPHSPAFMRACDELGIIVIDAILGWQYYNDTDEFREYCYRSATNLIRRDRNHPCVLVWEVSLNETQMPIPFMKQLHRIVHTEFPGENVYSGGWMPEVYDVFFQARQHRIMHGYHPEINKPYMVSEYGDWEYYSNNAGLNQDKLDKTTRLETSSRQLRGYGEKRLLQQAYNLQESLNDNMNTMAYGDGYWVMYDYNRGYHDEIESSGIMDIFRLRKFGYDFYASQQSPFRKVVTEIATYWNEDSALDVKVFSNTDVVKLYLNGELVDERDPDGDVNATAIPHPPFTFKMDAFEPGTLKAVGYIDGVAVSEDIVSTPGEAVRLSLCIDESGKPAEAGVNDVLFLYIAAVDEAGVVVPDYAGTISLQLPEGIELMNPDAIIAEAGIATALIRIGESAGDFAFEAVADGLESGALEIQVIESH